MISPAGALGLMQVMPDTYAQMRQQYDLGADPFNAHDNIFAGAAYLRWLHKKYGYPAMFAAYNAGPGRLEDHLAHGKKLPAETRAYISGITRVLGHPAKIRVASSVHYANLTRPDGKTVRIDPGEVTGIRAPLPGEYADDVKTVVSIGKRQQALREDVASATQAILKAG
jgi:membrane-bound lytic murein transglycosylase B